MQAGAAQFARHGYEAVNSNQIAREAGVGVGTFYRHFPDKSALADALMLQAWEELGTVMPGPEVDEPLEFALGATRAVVAYAAGSPDKFRAAFCTARSSKVALSMRPLERRLRQLAERSHSGPSLDPVLAARAWWAMISGTLVWWLEDPSRVPAEPLSLLLTQLHPLMIGRTLPE